MDKLARDDILSMEAGREMDALIAEYVMGWQHCLPHKGTGFPPGKSHSIHNLFAFPKYSTNISAAWEVVRKMESLEIIDQWKFVDELRDMAGDILEFIFWLRPVYICRAALLATLEPQSKNVL